MKKRNSKEKKKMFNLKTTILFGGVFALLAIIGGVTTIVALNNKEEKTNSQNSEIARVIPKKCPYTLEEIYEKVRNGYLRTCLRDDGREKCTEFANILFNFYDYFNKDTKFLAASSIDLYGPELIVEYDYYTYDEYQKVLEYDFFQVGKNDCDSKKEPGLCVPMAKHFIPAFAKLKERK